MIAITETIISIFEAFIYVIMNFDQIRTARRMGLTCKVSIGSVNEPPSLKISIPKPELVGVIKLKRDSERVLIHQSTKRERTWQCSYFKENFDQEQIFDKNFYSMQEALDQIRSEGFRLHTLMLKSGVVLF